MAERYSFDRMVASMEQLYTDELTRRAPDVPSSPSSPRSDLLLTMCGIAGIVSFTGLSDQAPALAVAMRDELDAPRARRSGPALRPVRRARPSPPQHHRSRQRPAADVQRRRRRSGSSSTARSTTIAEIRAELEAQGHRFRTHSDTEAIVHAYEEWGDGCVRPAARHVRVRDLGRDRGSGCCSCAIASASSRSTTALDGGTVTFGSEIKALLAASGCARASWNPEALDALPRASVRARARGPSTGTSRSCRRRTCSSSRTAASSLRRYWTLKFTGEADPAPRGRPTSTRSTSW